MTLLDEPEIDAALAGHPGWKRRGEEIVREFEFDDFVGSVAFVDAVVEPAERMGHHPDISISWNRVEVSISTHSEGGLTEADFRLAAEIDRLRPNRP
ncbi:MAG: 4a-hydroxytetrahydrobiopterin dehydratase [Solirubrobacterales bacterium]|nr:4a-hydroxytetrahydrobiopterin dehydratase [Solirubrobacterales bacterium]